ncbi:hypothetical protein BX600DRAFT_462704 [Xylariales sp. PMI_506]|nr:hypothetical protein BX600DRAFT_462704 [Xylariales sp. PMI_506]
MTTPAFEFPTRMRLPQIRFVGPLIPTFDETFAPPPWWDEMLAHPREKVVHITQGTIATDAEKLIKPAVRSLADRDDLLIIITGKDLDQIFKPLGQPGGSNGDSTGGGADRPPNVRTAEFVPHARLLPHVGVMVTNAGYNGVLAALSCGVPLVCAGRSEDKADVSSRVAWSGAGVDLGTDNPAGAAVRTAVLRVIEDASFREAAARIQKDFSAHNGPSEAADALETIARKSTGS